MIGNKKFIDWDSIIESLPHKDGDLISMSSVLNKSTAAKTDDELFLSYKEICDTWVKAGYDVEKICWYDYYPEEHFAIEVQEKFSEIVSAIPRRVWISEIHPGRCAPYHWDVEDNEKEWLEYGELVRYTCFIDKPRFGHVFIIEDRHFYNVEQNTIVKWDHYKNYHAGTNCGYEPYYLFHFLGTPL